MKVLEIKDKAKRVKKVREIMESAGNKVASVHFIKRSDGTKRRLSYRLHVSHPTYAKIPKAENRSYRKEINKEKNLITVFDNNTLIYSKKGNLRGRGGYKSVPLDNVFRICVNGEIYKIVS